MTKKTKQNMLELYDEALNKTKAIRDISKTFNISRFELVDMLYENGRPIPEKLQEKNEEMTKAEEDVVPDQETENVPDQAAAPLPIPNYIFEVLIKELDSLDMQINAMSQKLADLSTKYTDISKFIKEYRRP